MKKENHFRPLWILFISILWLVVSPARLWAANTAAGTDISNQATVGFSVGGVAQTAITSNAYTFKVDRKIIFTLTRDDSAAVSVNPGTNDNVLTYTLTNTGNGTQDFSLSAVAKTGTAAAFTGTDNVNATTTSVQVESGGTVGYQSAQDSGTYVDELAAGASKKIYIVGNFTNTGFANGDIASYHLLVTAHDSGAASTLGSAATETSGADTTGTVDTVFADGQGTYTSGDSARDGKFSADDDFVIASAILTVTKSSAVISDPFNNTTNPKAIPQAVVEYTITVSNGAGAQTATGISMTDSLNTEITAGTLAFNANTYAAGKGIQITAPNINGGAAKELTNAGSDDEGDWNITGTNTVTVTGIQLTAGQSATLKFRVTIQ